MSAPPSVVLSALACVTIASVLIFAGPRSAARHLGQYAPFDSVQVDDVDCNFNGPPRECAGHVYFQTDAQANVYGVGRGAIVMYAPACSRVIFTSREHQETELARYAKDYPEGETQDGRPTMIWEADTNTTPVAWRCKQYPVRPGVVWSLRPNLAALSAPPP